MNDRLQKIASNVISMQKFKADKDFKQLQSILNSKNNRPIITKGTGNYHPSPEQISQDPVKYQEIATFLKNRM